MKVQVKVFLNKAILCLKPAFLHTFASDPARRETICGALTFDIRVHFSTVTMSVISPDTVISV